MNKILSKGILKNLILAFLVGFLISIITMSNNLENIDNKKIEFKSFVSTYNSTSHSIYKDDSLYVFKNVGSEELTEIINVNEKELVTLLAKNNKEIKEIDKPSSNFYAAFILSFTCFNILFAISYLSYMGLPYAFYKTKKEKTTFFVDFVKNYPFYNAMIFSALTMSSKKNKKANILIFSSFFILLAFLLTDNNTKVENELSSSYLYSDFVSEIKDNNISLVDIVIEDNIATVISTNSSGKINEFKLDNNVSDLSLILQEHNVKYDIKNKGESFSYSVLVTPILIILLLLLVFSGLSKAISSKGSILDSSKKFNFVKIPPDVKLDDIKALGDEVKQEVNEIIELMNLNNEDLSRLGGKAPRGALITGSPGVGKTLLAKAIANETKCSFISASGSSFGGIIQGAGVQDVKKIFEIAKKNQPCIIFIDEFDSIGKKRGEGFNSRDVDTTLNELLVQLDGFDDREEILVLAATNYVEKLDPAVSRAGRFDRHIVVPLPDYKGRLELLDFYIEKIRAVDELDLEVIAHHTTGFSGADIANLVNEATLIAARTKEDAVGQKHFDEAKDKLILGHKLSIEMNEEEKIQTAFHEAGHTVVSMKLLDKGHDPAKKVSILPRGKALGVTMYAPDEEKYSHSKEKMESQISSLYGGRIAEIMAFGKNKITTGASNDYKVATQYAEQMIKHYGLGDEYDLLTLGYRDNTYNNDLSEKDKEAMSKILKENYKKASEILKENSNLLLFCTKALLKYDTIDENQIKDIMNGMDIAEDQEIPDSYIQSLNA
jgi:cell division protease FtsH